MFKTKRNLKSLCLLLSIIFIISAIAGCGTEKPTGNDNESSVSGTKNDNIATNAHTTIEKQIIYDKSGVKVTVDSLQYGEDGKPGSGEYRQWYDLYVSYENRDNVWHGIICKELYVNNLLIANYIKGEGLTTYLDAGETTVKTERIYITNELDPLSALSSYGINAIAKIEFAIRISKDAGNDNWEYDDKTAVISTSSIDKLSNPKPSQYAKNAKEFTSGNSVTVYCLPNNGDKCFNKYICILFYENDSNTSVSLSGRITEINGRTSELDCGVVLSSGKFAIRKMEFADIGMQSASVNSLTFSGFNVYTTDEDGALGERLEGLPGTTVTVE